MKKILCLLMVTVMALCGPAQAYAAGDGQYKGTCGQTATLIKKLMEKPVVELEENRITSLGERHIKIDWEHINGAGKYQIQIADNRRFAGADCMDCLTGRGTFYNFAELEDAQADYYIRIRPVFIIGEYKGEYITLPGRWSDTVAAEYETAGNKTAEPTDT